MRVLLDIKDNKVPFVRKGKSGGARVITYVQVLQSTVYLLTIFDKSDQENIPDKELEAILKSIPS